MSEITVEASIATDTSTGVEGGKDVDFTLTLPDGSEIEGEVTLVRHECSGNWRRWGQLDHWLDGRTIRALRDRDGARRGDVLDAIESACAEEC